MGPFNDALPSVRDVVGLREGPDVRHDVSSVTHSTFIEGDRRSVATVNFDI